MGGGRRGEPAARRRRARRHPRLAPRSPRRARRTLEWYKAHLADWAEEASTFGDFPSLYVGLVDGDGSVAYSDGALRVVDADGQRLADDVDPRPYWDYIGEAVEPWSYLKSTYWKAAGYPDGMYRVGPLARLNVVDQLGTDEADGELAEYRQRLGRFRRARSTTTTPG